MTMPEMALRFILSNPDVSTVIPGMRKLGMSRPTSRPATGGAGRPTLIGRLRAASLGPQADPLVAVGHPCLIRWSGASGPSSKRTALPAASPKSGWVGGLTAHPARLCDNIPLPSPIHKCRVGEGA